MIGVLVAGSLTLPHSEEQWKEFCCARDDHIAGAAGFMALATVDAYIVTPLTCIHPWCAHFAEVIVEAYLYEIQGTEPATYPPDFRHVRANMIEIHVECLQPLDLATQDLLSCRTGINEAEDPSQFVTLTAARKVIMNVDAASHALEKEVPGIRNYSNRVAAASIPLLAKVGAPSWGSASSESAGFQPGKERLIFAHAKLSMLRASYLTIMLRAAGSVEPGLEPGLEQDSELVTGLAYTV
ncbi:hypothetical protein HOY82DRAFT_586482 [Tuber indicum]|nr:hypothetical protein HOY82DRAFT_586482 [Tuber indicum]